MKKVIPLLDNWQIHNYKLGIVIVRIKYKQYKINDLACSIMWQGNELFIIIMTSHVNSSQIWDANCIVSTATASYSLLEWKSLKISKSELLSAWRLVAHSTNMILFNFIQITHAVLYYLDQIFINNNCRFLWWHKLFTQPNTLTLKVPISART